MKSERGWQKRALTGLIGVCMFFLLPQDAFPQQLAIHATQAEVTIWRQRMVSGPYKDGWDRIKSNADAFVSNPGAREDGNTTNDCWDWTTKHLLSNFSKDRELRDAGFAYLITGTISYRNAARDALLAQMAKPGTDFSNTSKFCPTSHVGGGLRAQLWLRRLAYGYSYIRDSLTAQQRSDIDAWFLSAATYFMNWADAIATNIFPNRASDDYTLPKACTSYSNKGTLYFGGPIARGTGFAWDNFAGSRTAFVASVAIMLDNTSLKARVKNIFQEWVRFNIFSNGALWDQHRWNADPVVPWKAYNYSSLTIGSWVTVADHFARAGDTSLYEYSTSEGICGSHGGPKSILKAMQHLAGQTNGTIIEYASTTSTSNPDLIIDHLTPIQNHIGFMYMTPGNVYFNDPSVKQAYSTSLPSSYWKGGYEPRSGDWGSYPDIRFMFGQQENAVWPYPSSGATDTTPPSPPKGLRIH